MTHWTRWTSQIYTEHSTLKQQNTHSSRMHMELSPEQTTYWATNQDTTNTKRLRGFPVFSRNTMLETGTQPQEEVWKEFKHLEAKDQPAQEY